MKVEDLEKDNSVSVGVNSKVLKIIKDHGLTIQKFLDDSLDKFISIEGKQPIEVSDAQLFDFE